jgi:ribosomal protein L37AE/L43A
MTDQDSLASYSKLEIVEEIERKQLDEPVRCPDCGGDITDTKSGQPLPDDVDGAERTFGWHCEKCRNTIPARALDPTASTFNDRMRGIEATFRDGHERYIPVPTNGGDGQ